MRRPATDAVIASRTQSRAPLSASSETSSSRDQGETRACQSISASQIDERLADETSVIAAAQVRDDLCSVILGVEDVRTERSMPPAVEREHRAVPLRCLPLARAEHEPGSSALRRASSPPDAPAPVHPQMAPDHDVALEREEEVLPGVHAFEDAAVDRSGDTGHETPPVRALRLDALAHEDLQAARDPMQAFALGHV